MSKARLLVTGASGQLGQRVAHHLLDTVGYAPEALTLITRTPERLSAFAERGVSVRRADFDDRGSLVEACAGVDRMLLISTADIGRRLEQHRQAIEVAAAAGVKHVVYTSMPGPSDSKVTFAPEHAGTEAALEASTLDGWTVLRNHWYFENLFMTLPTMKATGKWFTSAGEGLNADVARDDLALAAAQALAKQTGKKTFTLSGAESLGAPQVAGALSEVLGHTIEVVPVTDEELAAGMTAAGVPGPVAELFASFDANTRSGATGTVTSDLETLIGRPPVRFDAWLAAHAEALRKA